jgi:peptidoglycan-associated lipoprotein
MRGGRSSAFLTLGSLGLVAVLSGCATFGGSSSTSPSEPPARTAEPAPAPTPVAATPAPAPAPVETAAPARSSNGYTELAGLEDVRFRAGQFTVVKADHKILDSVVRWMKDNPGTTVMVEGHADDQGTREENLAAGEKRATSVMRYLVSKGLEPSRIAVSSAGSDRPVCAEKTDVCRAKNRRARFLVKR